MKAVVYHGPRKTLDRAPEAYEHFDNRDEGWTKVVLHPRKAA